MAGNQELSGFRLWWRKNRKWMFGILAAAIMGVLLFYPGMAYIYERIGWRSPLLPRPGTEWLMLNNNEADQKIKVRWDTEEISSAFYCPAKYITSYVPIAYDIIPGHRLLSKEAIERSYRDSMDETVALVVLEVIDYVDVTSESLNGPEPAGRWQFSLAHCQVTQVLAQRREVCHLQEGENIVVWMLCTSKSTEVGEKSDEPQTLIRCGQKSIQMLKLSKDCTLFPYARGISAVAPYQAQYNIGSNYIPVEEGQNPNLTSALRFLYLPKAVERYGLSQFWTLDILSKELQDYYDHSSYYYGRS